MSIDVRTRRLKESLRSPSSMVLLCRIGETGGRTIARHQDLIHDIKIIVSYAIEEFEKSLTRIRYILEIQSIGGEVQPSLIEKEKRHREALKIGKGILKKLDELR